MKTKSKLWATLSLITSTKADPTVQFQTQRMFGLDIVGMWCLQKDRFLKTGWGHADALDMMTIYSMLPQDDVAR